MLLDSGDNSLYVLTGLRKLPLFFPKILYPERVTYKCLTSSGKAKSGFFFFPRSKILLHAFIFTRQLTPAAERTSDARGKEKIINKRVDELDKFDAQ